MMMMLRPNTMFDEVKSVLPPPTWLASGCVTLTLPTSLPDGALPPSPCSHSYQLLSLTTQLIIVGSATIYWVLHLSVFSALRPSQFTASQLTLTHFPEITPLPLFFCEETPSPPLMYFLERDHLMFSEIDPFHLHWLVVVRENWIIFQKVPPPILLHLPGTLTYFSEKSPHWYLSGIYPVATLVTTYVIVIF